MSQTELNLALFILLGSKTDDELITQRLICKDVSKWIKNELKRRDTEKAKKHSEVVQKAMDALTNSPAQFGVSEIPNMSFNMTKKGTIYGHFDLGKKD